MVQHLVDVLNGVIIQLHVRLLALLALAGCPSSPLRRLEVVHQVRSALDTRIGQLADLLGVVAVPAAPAEVPVELENKLRMDEVGKGVAHIARVVVINGQIQEIYP